MRVRCVSPHGGGHHGLDGEGRPLPAGYEGPRVAFPPSERGYVECAAVAPHPVAVGSVVDAPDGYEPDGYHFVPADGGPPPLPAPAAATLSGLAGLLRKGDE